MVLREQIAKKIGQYLIPAIIISFMVITWLDPGFLEVWEAKTLDFRFLIRGRITPDPRIVIVAIDEKSIQELGRWPWSRDTMAALLEKIAAFSPKVVAFDILFSEKEAETATLPHPLSLDRKAVSLSEADRRFQSAITAAGNVILSVAFDVPITTDQSKKQAFFGEVPSYLRNFSYSRVRQTPLGKVVPPIQAAGVLPPLRDFIEASAGLGHVYAIPDRDTVLRREFVWLKYQGDYYPPLALQAARIYLGLSEMEVELRLGEGVRLGSVHIPTDERGRMLINYHGKEETFPYYSASDVWHGRIAASKFSDKLVLIGTSALSTFDHVITPFSNAMPGVEKNASVADSILTQRFLHRTDIMKGIDLLFLLLIGLLLWRYLPRLHAVGGFFLASSLFVAHLMVATFLFIRWGTWIYIFHPLGAIAVSYVGFTVYQYYSEEKKAKEIQRMFSSYVSPRIVKEMIKNPELAKLGGRREEVTILFSDIRSFTHFCEKHSPADVVELLNEYLGAMTDVVFRWEGTLDKFVGDAVMVFWGAPTPQEDHAERAIRCALHMRKKLTELQEKWRSEGREPLDIGIGINTGTVIVGNMGAEGKKMDYTVIGDPVNLAARVESLTRKYDYPLIITENTYDRVKEIIETHHLGHLPSREADRTGVKKLGRISISRLDDVTVKGREQSVAIYGIVGIVRERA